MSALYNDPMLLTPGPLTTKRETKEVMLHDWGSRDQTFIDATKNIREKLVEISHGGDHFTTVPLQGSGTFAVEAMIGTFVPRGGKLLVIVNGAYGYRIAKICDYFGCQYVLSETPEDTLPDANKVESILMTDVDISHVAIIHCETTSGILNPITEVASVVANQGRRLLIDSMSAFGAIPLNLSEVICDAVATSSNKCFEGVPGMGLVICRKTALLECEGNAHSLSLDLFDQWREMEKNGQWRFTPPTHVVFAFQAALDAHELEGGVLGRYARYTDNCNILIDGMCSFGFEALLPNERQAPIIVTFRTPGDPNFDFDTFYNHLKDKGFIIYPGKLTIADSFRMGCIGALDGNNMRSAIAAVGETMYELGIKTGRPS